MSQVESGGTVYFKVNGTQQSIEGNVKVSLGGPSRTPKVGSNGTVLGWTTKYSAPDVSVDISDSHDLSIKTLQSLSGATITVELGNGKTYVLQNGFTVGTMELDCMEGKVPWKLSGMSITEQTA